MHSSAAFSFLGYASSLQNLLLGSQNLVDTRDLLGTVHSPGAFLSATCVSTFQNIWGSQALSTKNFSTIPSSLTRTAYRCNRA